MYSNPALTRIRSLIQRIALQQRLSMFLSACADVLPDTATVFRTFHLQLLQQVSHWRQPEERKKVIIYKDFKMAFFQSLIHLPPLVVAILLIVWNVQGWIGGSDMDTVVSNSLQFAAKVFELLMQASIATIVLAIVRQHVIKPEGLPFGIFMAAAHTTDLSFLWSIELWGGLIGKWPTRKLTKALLVFIPFLVALAAVVGPSGAILLIPRPVTLHRGRSLAFLLPTSLMYPNRVGSEHMSIFDDANLNQSLSDVSERIVATRNRNVVNLPPFWSQQVYMTGMNHTSNDTSDDTWSSVPHGCRIAFFTDYEANYHEYFATVPNALVSALLPFIASDADDYVYLDPSLASTTSTQPFVRVSFNQAIVEMNETRPSYDFGFWDIKGEILVDPVPYDEILRDRHSVGAAGQAFAFETTNHTVLLAWLDNSVVQWPYRRDVQEITIAVLDAFWVKVPINSSSDACVGTSDKVFLNLTTSDEWPRADEGPVLRIQPDWARRISQLARTLQPSVPGRWDLTTIAPAFALGLSSIQYPFFNTTIPWWVSSDEDPLIDLQVMPLHSDPSQWSDYHTSFNTTELQERWYTAIYRYLAEQNRKPLFKYYYALLGEGDIDASTLETLDVISYRRGFGYSTESKTVRAALAFIGLYCLVAAGYVCYTFATRKTGGSWDTVGELYMLAMNSTAPRNLGATSVGVETMATFRKRVKVEANPGGSVEMVFEGEDRKLGMRDVVLGEEY